MFNKAKFACMILCSLGLAACGGGILSSAPSHLAFVSLTSNNTIAAYRINNNTGAFTAITGSPYFAGNSPTSLLLHPSGKYLYAANQLGNSISLFAVDSNSGSITEVLPETPAGVSPVSMVMNASGSLLFVANAFSSNISVYSINSANGALSQIAGSPFATYAQPGELALTPSANFLYTMINNPPSILGFAVSSSGALRALQPLTLPQIQAPFAAAMDPAGKYLYVTNPADNALSIFSINSSTGVLTAVPQTPIATGTSPVAVAVQPNGQFVYVANNSSNNLSIYSIDSTTGVPTQITGSPFSVTSGPLFLQWDPNGQWLYVGGQSTKTIAEYSFSANGTLTAASQSITTAQTPTSMAVGR